MADLSTEPKMMRSQQDKDTRADIAEDETRNKTPRKDADAESGRDRELSKTGRANYETEQMDAIFEENKAGATPAAPGSENRTAEETARKGEAGLASKGRSRLGD
ncbi:hypothetical protein U0C82_14890 [Fulvimarina sp. 2208YS6-2-32]|uniref:Uncharacterized protein n=1 Tax=Fulvimarina uroteuthidis TaxID=3098149 RepID=A0ABU5I5D9_9HYPH|nr:hypothetical protein [Fulvimarina sp. 2208YS6-2-32]MDY8110426.1 hypothetical protein [Fulvimarina sp. 2208YS6-2-32]